MLAAVVTTVPATVLTVLLIAWIALGICAVAKALFGGFAPAVSWVGFAVAALIVLVAWFVLGGST
jgi:hypothetical protein